MPFPESLTKEVRRRTHFQCCLCKAIGIEIHHIIPQAEGGADTIDNAAPLCPSCHETYGANPTKRKLIREARDLWFEICDKRYASDASLLSQVYETVSVAASKQDLSAINSGISEILKSFRPRAGIRSFSVPRNGSGIGPGPHPIDIRDVLLMVHGENSDYEQGGLLCIKELWPVKDGYRATYNDFLQRFGTRTLLHLASRALAEINAPQSGGLTEAVIESALSIMGVEAVCMNFLDKGEFSAALNDQGQIIWSIAGDPSTAGPQL